MINPTDLWSHHTKQSPLQTPQATFSGWWFGRFCIFPYIRNFIIPIDFHIFQRAGEKPPSSFCWVKLGPHFFLPLPNPLDTHRSPGDIGRPGRLQTSPGTRGFSCYMLTRRPSRGWSPGRSSIAWRLGWSWLILVDLGTWMKILEETKWNKMNGKNGKNGGKLGMVLYSWLQLGVWVGHFFQCVQRSQPGGFTGMRQSSLRWVEIGIMYVGSFIFILLQYSTFFLPWLRSRPNSQWIIVNHCRF